MFELNPIPYFEHKVGKLINSNPTLELDIEECLSCLQFDPRDPRLKTHKVTSRRFGIKWSCRVSGNIRIIWDYSKDQINVLDLFDIGKHNGANKVYKKSSN